jgi:glutamate formiminotransferase
MVRELRASSTGMKGVKAIAAMAQGRAQIAMNIIDFEATPISQVHRAVANLAARHKVDLAEGEIIGLLPEAACERESDWMRQLSGFETRAKILEHRLANPLAWPAAN